MPRDEESNLNKCANPGTVFLVGAGPGDPGLITLKGLEAIRTADVIVYDYLAGRHFIDEAKPDAELIYVGKKGRAHTVEQIDINALLVEKAREGKEVVRLKGGDPYVFGRGGEEVEELLAAEIPFEVVPGVTSRRCGTGICRYSGYPSGPCVNGDVHYRSREPGQAGVCNRLGRACPESRDARVPHGGEELDSHFHFPHRTRKAGRHTCRSGTLGHYTTAGITGFHLREHSG